jgi:hypothetical protein
MKTQLFEAMTSGVFVEVRDAQGNSIGQAVYTDWKSRPLPAVGDTLCCELCTSKSGRKQKVRGRVRSRHFEVQRQADGEPSVWAQLILEQIDPSTRSRSEAVKSRSLSDFSQN